jgi:hypothetical protein
MLRAMPAPASPSEPLLSDRAKRRLALWPTAVLPRALRVALREPALRRLEVGKAERGVGIVIGHPKSGNTWLRTMISRVYQLRHGLPETLVLKTDELHRRVPEIPSFCFTNGWYSYESVIGEILAPGHPDCAIRRKPVVLLSRHPCDIAVSWHNQFTRRVSPSKRELINASLPRPIDHRNIALWEFVRHSPVGLPSLIDFLNTWERNLAQLPLTLRTSYEELRADPARTLERVAGFLGLGFSREEIAEAVRFGSFENMRALEQSGRVRHGGLAVVDPSDPATVKVRRGKVGGYREDFTPEQVAELERMVAEKLSPSFGYGGG